MIINIGAAIAASVASQNALRVTQMAASGASLRRSSRPFIDYGSATQYAGGTISNNAGGDVAVRAGQEPPEDFEL